MKRGATGKAIEKTVNYTLEGMYRASPHVIKAHEFITHKVIMPAGMSVLSGTATVLASIIAPKRKR